jgi:HPr kinase/phosphorylase
MQPEILPGRWFHGTALALEGRAVLILGPSGAGKSRLACDMLFHGSEAGRKVSLIGDDRVRIIKDELHLLVEGHPDIHGKLEVRGLGIIDIAASEPVPLRWIVIISDTQERMPHAQPMQQTLLDRPFESFSVTSSAITATALLGKMLESAAFVTRL